MWRWRGVTRIRGTPGEGKEETSLNFETPATCNCISAEAGCHKRNPVPTPRTHPPPPPQPAPAIAPPPSMRRGKKGSNKKGKVRTLHARDPPTPAARGTLSSWPFRVPDFNSCTGKRVLLYLLWRLLSRPRCRFWFCHTVLVTLFYPCGETNNVQTIGSEKRGAERSLDFRHMVVFPGYPFLCHILSGWRRTKTTGTGGAVGGTPLPVSGLGSMGPKSIAMPRPSGKMGPAQCCCLGHCHIRRHGSTEELMFVTPSPRRRSRHLAASMTARQFSPGTRTGWQIMAEAAAAVAAVVYGRGFRRATARSNRRAAADARTCTCRAVTHRKNKPMPTPRRRSPRHVPCQPLQPPMFRRPCSTSLPMVSSITASIDHRRQGVPPLLGVAAPGTHGMDTSRWPRHLGRERSMSVPPDKICLPSHYHP
jgi:hypothetical protein